MNADIGSLVREKRVEAGISLRDVARATGMTPTRLSRVELELAAPDLKECVALYMVIPGIPITKIFSWRLINAG